MQSGSRRLALALPLVIAGASVLALAPGASGAKPAAMKPVIGKAVVTPTKASAGAPLSISMKVTRSDTGRLLTRGALTAAVTAAGKQVPHKGTFRSGVARLTLVVPANAKTLRVGVTIKAGGQSATRTFLIGVLAAPDPGVAVGDATVAEGNGGTTTMSFPVTLSKASALPITVAYTTVDGTATASADYAPASGTLSFAPGETQKTVAVSIVADTAIESDEYLKLALFAPVRVTLDDDLATGTITNDDIQVAIATGSWKGQTPTGDFLYFEVNDDRTMSYFRINDIKESCSPGGYFEGSLAFRPELRWAIADNGAIERENTWTGSEANGAVTYTSETYRITATFNGPTATGTIRLQDGMTYAGTPYSCDTGEVAWTATKVS